MQENNFLWPKRVASLRWPLYLPGIILLAGLITLASLQGSQSAAQGEDSDRWQGTISITSSQLNVEPGMTTCNFSRTFHIKARLKEEDERFDVTDRNGNLIGQRVKLVDDGSTWTSTQEGSCSNTSPDPCDCLPGFESGCRTTILHSDWSGSGSGTIDIEGTVYYSFVEDDSLPNGMYSVGAPSSHTVMSEGRLLITAKCCYDTKETELPLSPVPYFVIGGDPQAPVTSHLNDNQIRTIATGSDAGSYSYTIDYGPKGHVDVTVQWNLWKKQVVDCTITEADYNWRPRHIIYDPDATPIEITARLKQPADAAAKFRFTLFDGSKELGTALNQGDSSDWDLRFKLNLSDAGQEGFTQSEETGDGYVIETTDPASEATVKVAAWDFGAWGRLKVEASLSEIMWATCTSEETGEIYVNIPRDDDDNHIADSWEDQWSVRGMTANSDADATPMGRENGDGFSNYEEYRGFFTQRDASWGEWGGIFGVWTSTNPNIKDLFIHDEIGQGVGPFVNTGLAIHFIDEDQYNGNESRLVNFNTGYAAARPARGQHGLYLHHAQLEQGTTGMVEPWIGSPNVVEEVLVDTNQAIGLDKLLHTIAHELGHAVNLTHAGDSWTDALCNGEQKEHVVQPGGVTSGDVNNVMRYYDAGYYIGSDGQCYEYPDYDQPGTGFCTDLKGTGLNGGASRQAEQGRPLPVAGDATWEWTCLQNMSLTSDEELDVPFEEN